MNEVQPIREKRQINAIKKAIRGRDLLLFTLGINPDGASFSYNHATHALVVTLPAGGTATVDAPGGTTWTGDIKLNGTLIATTDVVGGGKSLKGHKHGGVQAGGAQTGTPV
ncbi:hypothetical protein [Sphingobium sp.]|uniref:hypothetical protein n=1 Tax=Sphingobium sp. TaxID=1912891 RepID=UPI0035C6CB1C